MTVIELARLVCDTREVTRLLSIGVHTGVSIDKTVLETAQRLLETYYGLVIDQEVEIK